MNLEQELVEATRYNSLVKLKSLFEGSNIPDIDHDQQYAIRWACSHGNLEMVKFLLETLKKPAKIYTPSKPLSDLSNVSFKWAVQSGNLELIKYLVQRPEFENFAQPEYLLESLDMVVRKRLENRSPEVSDFISGSQQVIEYLLDMAEMPVIKEREIFYKIASINSLELLDFFMNHPKSVDVISDASINFTCYRAVVAKAYDCVDNLVGKYENIITFNDYVHGNVIDNNAWRLFMTQNYDAFKFILNHAVLKNKIDINHDKHWKKLLKIHNSMGDSNGYKIFEYLACAKGLNQHIDFFSNDYEGFKLLGTDLKAWKIIKKHKSVWNKPEFLDWVSSQPNVAQVFKDELIKRHQKQLDSQLRIKPNHNKTVKI